MSCRVTILLASAMLFAAPSALPQAGVRELYNEAQQAQNSGDLAAATRKYETIIRLEPGMAEAHANLGNLYYQQAQFALAKTAYRKALSLKPGLSAPHFFLGVMAFNEHQYASALEQLQKAALTPNPLVYAYLGYTHFARAEFALAAQNLEKASEDIDTLYHLSKSYGHLADNSFAKLQAADAGSVYILLARAHLAESKEDWKEAARQYTLARQKMPENARLAWRAESAEGLAEGNSAPVPTAATDVMIDGSLSARDSSPATSKLKQEIAVWRRKAAIGASPPTASDLYRQGEAYQALAYLASLAVMEADPDSYRAHQLRAQMFEEANNDEGAIREYQEALRRKPDLQNIHFAIGTLYWKDHHLEEAAKELEAEIKTNPNHPQALYELGDIAASDGRAAEAEKLFLEAVKLEPHMIEPRYALEKIYTGSGRLEKSVEQLLAVLKINSNEVTAHYRLAVLYRKLGRTREAEQELALFDKLKTSASSLEVK